MPSDTVALLPGGVSVGNTLKAARVSEAVLDELLTLEVTELLAELLTVLTELLEELTTLLLELVELDAPPPTLDVTLLLTELLAMDEELEEGRLDEALELGIELEATLDVELDDELTSMLGNELAAASLSPLAVSLEQAAMSSAPAIQTVAHSQRRDIVLVVLLITPP